MNINYKKNLSSLLFEEKENKVRPLQSLDYAPFFLVPPNEFQPLKDQLRSGVYKNVKTLLNKENSLRGNTKSTPDEINSDNSLKDTAGLEKGDGLANLPYNKILNIAKLFMVKYKSAIKSLNVEDEITRQQLMKFEVPPIPLGENFNINILNVKNEDTSSPNNNDLKIYTELGFAFFTLTMKAKEKSEEGSKNDKINITRYLANNNNVVVFAMPIIKNFTEEQIKELKKIGLLGKVNMKESFVHNSSLKNLLFESGTGADFGSPGNISAEDQAELDALNRQEPEDLRWSDDEGEGDGAGDAEGDGAGKGSEAETGGEDSEGSSDDDLVKKLNNAINENKQSFCIYANNTFYSYFQLPGNDRYLLIRSYEYLYNIQDYDNNVNKAGIIDLINNIKEDTDSELFILSDLNYQTDDKGQSGNYNLIQQLHEEMRRVNIVIPKSFNDLLYKANEIRIKDFENNKKSFFVKYINAPVYYYYHQESYYFINNLYPNEDDRLIEKINNSSLDIKGILDNNPIYNIDKFASKDYIDKEIEEKYPTGDGKSDDSEAESGKGSESESGESSESESGEDLNEINEKLEKIIGEIEEKYNDIADSLEDVFQINKNDQYKIIDALYNSQLDQDALFRRLKGVLGAGRKSTTVNLDDLNINIERYREIFNSIDNDDVLLNISAKSLEFVKAIDTSNLNENKNLYKKILKEESGATEDDIRKIRDAEGQLLCRRFSNDNLEYLIFKFDEDNKEIIAFGNMIENDSNIVKYVININDSQHLSLFFNSILQGDAWIPEVIESFNKKLSQNLLDDKVDVNILKETIKSYESSSKQEDQSDSQSDAEKEAEDERLRKLAERLFNDLSKFIVFSIKELFQSREEEFKALGINFKNKSNIRKRKDRIIEFLESIQEKEDKEESGKESSKKSPGDKKEEERSKEEQELFSDSFLKQAMSIQRAKSDVSESLSHILFDKDLLNEEDVSPTSSGNEKVSKEDKLEYAHQLYQSRIQALVSSTFRVIGKDVYDENFDSNKERQEKADVEASKADTDASIAGVLGGYASIPALFALAGISGATLGLAPAVALGSGYAIKKYGNYRAQQLRNLESIKSEDLKRLEGQIDDFTIQLREIILRLVKDAKGIKESAIFKTNLSQFLFEAESGTFIAWNKIERELESTSLFIYDEEFVNKFEENPRKLEQIRSRFAGKLGSLIKVVFDVEVQGIEATTPEKAGYYTFVDNNVNMSAPQGQSAMPQGFANALPNPPKSPSGPMNEIEQFMSLMNHGGGGLFAALMFMMIQQQFGSKVKKGQSMMDVMQMFFGSLAKNQDELPDEVAEDENVQEAMEKGQDPKWLRDFYTVSTGGMPTIKITYTENDKKSVKEELLKIQSKLEDLNQDMPNQIVGINCDITLKKKNIAKILPPSFNLYVSAVQGDETKILVPTKFTKDIGDDEKITSKVHKFSDIIIVSLLSHWWEQNYASTTNLIKQHQRKRNAPGVDYTSSKQMLINFIANMLLEKGTDLNNHEKNAVDQLFQESRRVKGDLISEHRELLEMWRKL